MPVHTTSTHAVPRVLRGVLVVVAAAIALLGLSALPASAHNPGITASADCTGKVSYTSTSWQSSNGEARANPDIRIQASVNGGEWREVGHGAYTAPGYAFSGTWDAGTPFPSSVKLRAYAAGTWGDGYDGHGYSGETTVAAPTNCTTSQPKAAIAHDCHGYDATLDNSASNVAVEFTVTVNGKDTKVTVAGGAVEHSKGDVAEDTSYAVAVSAGGTTLASSTFTVDCVKDTVLEPKASITHDCDGYDATLDNSGSNEAVDFVVTVNGESTKINVPAGKVTHETGAVEEDEDYTITVSANGKQLATSTFTVDCTVVVPPTTPKASITHDCDGYDVTLDNTEGDAPVDVEVTVNGTSTTVSVPAGEVKHSTGHVTEDTHYTVRATADGETLASASFTVNCTKVTPPTTPTTPTTPTSGVSSTTTTSAAALPATGNGVAGWQVALGFGLVTAGLVALGRGLRRTA